MNQILAIKDQLDLLSDEDLAAIDTWLPNDLWTPQIGPQAEAHSSAADVVFYGGSAGGGKTDLEIGLCLMDHSKSIIFRREATQLTGIVDRVAEILGDREKYHRQEKIWRLGEGRQLELGSCKDLGDEKKYQGRPHDLICFDEITHFLESQFRYLTTWLRTTLPGQRCRIVCAGNPPTDADGAWVREYWGPWLDPIHPDPAKPGELRWYTTIDGKDVPCEDGAALEVEGRMVIPQSRTFIPSRVPDNVFLAGTNYESTLQALPEPLRSQMLNGDFVAGTDDHTWQVIPTAWVQMAMDRWTEKEIKERGPLDSIGVDPSRGGRDETIIAKRNGNYFPELKSYPGAEIPDGPVVCGLVVPHMKDDAPVHVDVIGIGSSVYDHFVGMKVHAVAVNNAEGTEETDRAKKLRMRNVRSADMWALREDLDPMNEEELRLPPDSKLKADLCAPRWKMTTGGVLIESKEDIKKRIGRSPDRGDAVIMANRKTAKKIITKPLNFASPWKG